MVTLTRPAPNFIVQVPMRSFLRIFTVQPEQSLALGGCMLIRHKVLPDTNTIAEVRAGYLPTNRRARETD